MLKRVAVHSTHEDLFVERYDRLLAWAAHISDQPDAAEDMVHDAFLRFTFVRPDLGRLENLDGYLYRMLQNLHLSRVRRQARARQIPFPLIDFDSVTIGLRGVDPARQSQVWDELRRICRYACLRARSSRAGSVLMLRFFHEYVPSEIAVLLRTNSIAVNQWLKLARREAKVYLDDPSRLRILGAEEATADVALDLSACADLVGALRRAIFARRHTRCFSSRELRRWYDASSARLIPAHVLGELVTCPDCLDAVTSLQVGTSIRPGRRSSGPSGGPSVGSGSAGGRSANRPPRLKDLFEHRPKELRIYANGFEIGSQMVEAAHSQLTLTANVDEPIVVVEVLSEQGFCLLAFDVEAAPVGPVRQHAHVALSEGRSLEATLSFAESWPSLRIEYRDPTWSEVSDAEHMLANQPDSGASPDEPSPAAGKALRWIDRLQRLGLPEEVRLVLRPRRAALTVLAIIMLTWLAAGSSSGAFAALERAARLTVQFVAALVDLRRARIPAKPLPAMSLPLGPAASPSISRHVTPTPPAGTVRMSEADLARLRVEVVSRLDDLDALTSEQVELRLTPAGTLHLSAIVDGEARKRDIQRAIAPLVSRALRVSLATTNEIASRRVPASAPPVVIQQFEITQNHTVATDVLRNHFARLHRAATTAQIDDDIRRFATEMLERSQRALLQTWAIKRLAADIVPERLRLVNPGAFDAWRERLARHAQRFQTEARVLREGLQPIFFIGSGTDADAIAVPYDDHRSLVEQIEQLVHLAAVQDEAVRVALAPGTGARAALRIDAAEFWTAFDEAARLAGRIAHDRPRP